MDGDSRQRTAQHGGERINKPVETRTVQSRISEAAPNVETWTTDPTESATDGDKINNEVLFKTTEEIEILFKLNIISNHDPQFSTDAGMRRRGLLMNFTNTFVEEDDYIPGVKGVYKKDKRLLNLFQNNDYKLAFFHILLPFAMKFYKSELFIPKCVKDQFKDLCGENDKMSAFIDSKLEKTGHIGDKMFKDELLMMYNTHYKVNCNWTTIFSDVKRCGLNYDRAGYVVYVVMSQRGVITGIRARNNLNKDLDEISPLEFGIEKQICLEDFKDDYEQKYYDLLAKYEALEASVRPLTPPEPIIVTYADDDMSVLTELSTDTIDFYRGRFGVEFGKLEKYHKNIQMINKKMLSIDVSDVIDLLKQGEFEKRLKENRAKIAVIMETFDATVRSNISDYFDF